MAIRTLTQIISDAVAYITSKRPTIATYVGTVTRDVVIESPAQEFSNVYSELSHTQQLQSLKYASSMTEQELDDFAVNYGMTRLAGTKATGTITFRARNFSIVDSDIIIPFATTISTTGTSAIPQAQFQTTQAVVMQAALASTYFNPSTGFYEITANIVAQATGSTSNVPAGTIVNLLTSVPGVDFVINTIAITGGQSTESNTAFASRIIAKLSGNNVGTLTGIESLVRSNVNVIDVSIVTPNDAEMIRNEFGGSVDVYILGQVISSTSEAYLYTTAGSQEFVLLRQPVKSISSITGIVSGAPFTFVQGVDFNFVADPTLLYNGSTQVQNKVVFNIGGTNPDNTSNITITYAYDSLIQDLQNQLDANANHIVTSDILVKESTVATIDVYIEVTIFPGYAQADTITAVQTAISTFVNNLALGDSINRSDIVGVTENLVSVDQVNLDTMILSKNAAALPISQQRLSITKTEYPRINTVTVTVI